MPERPSSSDAYRLLATFLFGALTGMASTGALVFRSPRWLVSCAVALPGWLWHLRLARRQSRYSDQESQR